IKLTTPQVLNVRHFWRPHLCGSAKTLRPAFMAVEGSSYPPNTEIRGVTGDLSRGDRRRGATSDEPAPSALMWLITEHVPRHHEFVAAERDPPVRRVHKRGPCYCTVCNAAAAGRIDIV